MQHTYRTDYATTRLAELVLDLVLVRGLEARQHLHHLHLATVGHPVS